MDNNKTLAIIAFIVGFIQMYNDFMKSDEADEKSKNTVILSVIASILWLAYQFRKDGPNFSSMYTTIGLFLQLYILNKILLKEKRKKKEYSDDSTSYSTLS